MKKITYLILTCLVAVFAGCKKDLKYTEDSNFYPRIFDNGNVFRTPNRIINEGQSAVYGGLVFSPKAGEKTKITWKLNGEVVSEDTTYTFTPTGGGQFEIKLEASYNGQTSTRISNVLVSPTTYTPKTYSYVSMGYLSENGVAASVNWDNVTHIAFNGARVIAGGAVDFSKGNLNQNIDEIVARGHIASTPVLLGVSGTLSGIDGWALYNSTNFGSVISDPTQRAALVTTLKDYVALHKLDGIDIMMTDVSNDFYDVSATAIQSITPFLNSLRAELPASAIITVTGGVSYMHWEYGNLSQADWINVHAFEDAAVGPGIPRAQPSSYAHFVNAANIWANFRGIPKNKIVLGLPAFGLRYNAIDANGNNESWGSYDYVPFKNIVAIDAAAASKEFVDSAFGIYYNGFPLINEKTTFIKDGGYKGAYLWALDYDADGENSLMATIHTALQ